MFVTLNRVYEFTVGNLFYYVALRFATGHGQWDKYLYYFIELYASKYLNGPF